MDYTGRHNLFTFAKPRCHGGHVAWSHYFSEHHLGIFKGAFPSRVGVTYTVSPRVHNSNHPLPQVLPFTARRITHSPKSSCALTFLPEWKHSPVGFTKEKHPIHYGVSPLLDPEGGSSRWSIFYFWIFVFPHPFSLAQDSIKMTRYASSHVYTAPSDERHFPLLLHKYKNIPRSLPGASSVITI